MSKIMPVELQFSWHLNFTRIKMLLIAIFPGLFVSICTGNLLWLTASFLTVCSILPYTSSHNSRMLVFIHAFLIAAVIYLVVFALRVNHYYLLLILPALAIVAGSIDNIHENLRSFSSWLIIGGVYGGVELSENTFSLNELIYLMLLTLISLSVVVFLFSKRVNPIRFRPVMPSNPQFIFNFKYVMPVIIITLIWVCFNLHEPQWAFWSSLSVVYPDMQDALVKLKQRAYGVLLGAGLGLLIGLLLPHSIIITYLCFVMIMLSLRMFQDYFPGFILRCFFAVLYAGNLSTRVAFVRMSDVILGGIIGITCTFLLVKIRHSKL